MENSELCIKVKSYKSDPTEPDVLVGFPFQDGQYLSYTEDDQNGNDDTEWLIIDLADRTDTTAAQDMFLRTNKQILDWTIR
jgi:hypothetical protein